ncbi:MAG TPA: 50S ribosomal protein L10 [Candidatus Nanopelagicaceae bacterium]|nr:50S ribosomal protein L10 [Candidatus Nanopelagicaceae bacterium]
MIGKHEVPQWKMDEVEHLVGLFRDYSNIAVIEVAKLNDKQIQEMRKILRGKAIIRMSKKSLQLRAIDKYRQESIKGDLDGFAERIPGQAALCFTDLNVFELKKIFNQSEWMVPAKPNEITPVDIWVRAGDTGLPTGQVISELNMTLRLPTRIQNDTIWIRDDTQTHHAGDFVDVKQAAVLKKLGVNPIESLIKIHYAWSDGEIIPEEILYMDMEQFQKDLTSAYFSAQNLALELGIVDKETIKPMIQKAHRGALGLLFELPVYFEELRDEYVRKAVLNANAINAMVLGKDLPVPETEHKKESKVDESEDEEDEEVGIGGLFG